MIRRLIYGLFVIVLCVGMSGCSTVAFYMQAIQGQAEILRKTRTMVAAARGGQIPGKTRRQLALVQNLRPFAQEQLQRLQTGFTIATLTWGALLCRGCSTGVFRRG